MNFCKSKLKFKFQLLLNTNTYAVTAEVHLQKPGREHYGPISPTLAYWQSGHRWCDPSSWLPVYNNRLKMCGYEPKKRKDNAALPLWHKAEVKTKKHSGFYTAVNSSAVGQQPVNLQEALTASWPLHSNYLTWVRKEKSGFPSKRIPEAVAVITQLYF